MLEYRPRIKMALKVVIVMALVSVIIRPAIDYYRDRPIPGGVLAYRPYTFEGKICTSCLCGHTGYYIIKDNLLLTYWPDHGDPHIQPEGEIIERGKRLIIQPIQYESDDIVWDPFTIKKMGAELHVMFPFSWQKIKDCKLKRTYFGADVRKLVDDFDLEEYKKAQAESIRKEKERSENQVSS